VSLHVVVVQLVAVLQFVDVMSVQASTTLSVFCAGDVLRCVVAGIYEFCCAVGHGVVGGGEREFFTCVVVLKGVCVAVCAVII
jgi:hypothetical protein